MCASSVARYPIYSITSYSTSQPEAILLGAQDPSPSSFRRLLLLVALVKGHRAGMIPAYVVKVLDLVDPDDPVLARESFFQRGELRPLRRETTSSNPILCLPRGEQRVIIVVRHLVPRRLMSPNPSMAPQKGRLTSDCSSSLVWHRHQPYTRREQ